MKINKGVTAEQFDKEFDEGEDVLKYFDLKNISRPNLLKDVRKKLKLSQSQFALLYNLNLRNIQNWEQGKAPINKPLQNYLKIILAQPKLVTEILNEK